MFNFVRKAKIRNATIEAMVEFLSINFNGGSMDAFAKSIFERHKKSNTIKTMISSGVHLTPHSLGLCFFTTSLFDEHLLNNPEIHTTIHKGIVNILKTLDYSLLCLENKTACFYVFENLLKLEQISDVPKYLKDSGIQPPDLPFT